MEELPRQTTVYRLPSDVFDDFIDQLEEATDTPKLDKLFAKPSAFTDCE